MRSRIVGLVALVLAWVGGAAHADVIFSNLGPSDSFNTTFSWFVAGLNTSIGQVFGNGSIMAMPFTVPAGPNVTFTGAELALTYLGARIV